jgi:hypothetical protein
MGRSNRVRLSDSELEQLKATRQIVYEDTSVPMGVVVKRACEELITDSNNEMGVQF